MDKKEKILELLGRESLTATEKDELEKLISHDEELGALVKTYEQLGKIINHSSHLNEDVLVQYTLYKNGLQLDDQSIIERIPFIEQHLRECQKCSELFKELNQEYSDVDNFISETFAEVKDEASDSKNLSQQIPVSRYKTPRYAFASILAAGFIYLALYIISSFATPEYYADAAIRQDSQFSISRGRATENFQNSLKALEQDKYDEAISYLKNDIKQNPDDNTIFYSYYIIGLSYLKTAEHDFLGLFPGYNRERVENGLQYLEESIRKNNSGKFNNIKLNSYFYLAKANLMLNDKNKAEKYLNMVISERGSKIEEAKYLLGEME